ncbi:MAG: O-acetyl-ADP-ribose deacetylase [Planctomycetes bacterium]|nr:O-acetyl-ADP-ribose deacetylase [Planctomycetota bacterium]
MSEVLVPSADGVEVVVGDITKLAVEAIVNAANTSLLGGGGVDGAIHRAAGPELLEECRKLGGCATGSAKITRGYRLAAKHVIHAVGPVWSHGDDLPTTKLGDCAEDVLLASCYHTALTLAEGDAIGSIAFPAISTGVYGFPKQRAAKIALGHVLGWLKSHDRPGRVTFCCFSEADAQVYRTTIETRGQWMTSRKRG